MASKTVTPPKAKPRGPTRMQTAAIQRNVWALTAPYEVSINDVKDPDYWVHVAKTLGPGDRIEVTALDQSWYVELLIRAATRSEVSMVVMREQTFEQTAVLAPDNTGFSVQWRGPSAKYSVIRDSDHHVMKSGCLDQSAAYAWLENRAKAEAA